MLWKHGKLPENQRQLAILTWTEAEFDGSLADLLHALDVRVVQAVHRRTFLGQRVEGPDHVLDGDRLAVVPTRLFAQREGDPRAVFRRLDRLRDQPVVTERLVERSHGQAVVEQALTEEADSRGGEPLRDERIEAVEGAERGQAEHAALGRVRIHVVEVRKASGVLEIAVHREAVRRNGLARGLRSGRRDGKQPE